MQNNRLGIHSDKIWADSTTQNTLKYLTTYLANRPKYLGHSKKKLSLDVHSPWSELTSQWVYHPKHPNKGPKTIKCFSLFCQKKWNLSNY
jgi:hypothetical protein